MEFQDKEIQIARSINWFDEPEALIQNQHKFLCYAMKFGLLEDVQFLLKKHGKDSFRKALNSDYQAILDPRSRAYFELITQN